MHSLDYLIIYVAVIVYHCNLIVDNLQFSLLLLLCFFRSNLNQTQFRRRRVNLVVEEVICVIRHRDKDLKVTTKTTTTTTDNNNQS